MRQEQDLTVYLKHIQDAIEAIQSYLHYHTFNDFLESQWDQAAVIRHLEIIGEAANKLGKDFQIQHPQLPWKQIVGLRNVLIHGYMDIDLNVVWQIISKDLSSLAKQIQTILTSENK